MTDHYHLAHDSADNGLIYYSKDDESDYENLKFGKDLNTSVRFVFTTRRDLSQDEMWTTPANQWEAGRFNFTTLPGCCGIVVSHGTRRTGLYQDWNKDVSNKFRKIKTEFAKKLGYSMMLATTDMSDVAAVSNMLKSKYQIEPTFTNKRTNNKVGIGVKYL